LNTLKYNSAISVEDSITITLASQNGYNTDCVLVHHLNRFDWVHHILPFYQIHLFQLNFKVPCKFLPVNLRNEIQGTFSVVAPSNQIIM
jgi:hypothetical protein